MTDAARDLLLLTALIDIDVTRSPISRELIDINATHLTGLMKRRRRRFALKIRLASLPSRRLIN